MNTIKKINHILSASQKKKFFILLFITSIVSFLDLVGIGAILPVLIVLADPSFVESKYIIMLLKNFSFLNEENFILYSITFLFLIFFIKTTVSIVLNFIRYKVLFGFYTKISNRLMGNYLNLPYSKFIQLKVYEKSNVIKTEVEYFVMGVLDPFLLIILETFTILLIFGFLLYYDAESAIKVTISISTVMFVLLYFFGKKLKKLGVNRLRLNNNLQQQIYQGLQGIKDIKLASKENNFMEKFSGITSLWSQVMGSINSWQNITRHILELITISTFVFLSLIGIYNEQEFSDLIILLGIFAAAAFRIMPSLNRIITSYNSIKAVRPVIDSIYKDINLDELVSIKKNKIYDISQNIQSIEINNLNFKFPTSKNPIIKDLNLKIKKGEYIGIFGKSGTGKTTFVDLFSGLLTLDSGSIKFDDKDISIHKDLWRKNISYVPQSIYLNDESIKQNIAFGKKLEEIDSAKIIQSLEDARLLEFVNSLDRGVDTLVGENGINLSGGQIQRLGIARALYRNAQVLIFDESTNSLDLQTENEFMDTVNKIKGDRTILFISHKISILQKCDKVYELYDKKLIQRNIK
tara:strand:+ start:160 stop:1890 length:1731 start_codon:yes stop_codon:yes gene_type:complete